MIRHVTMTSSLLLCLFGVSAKAEISNRPCHGIEVAHSMVGFDESRDVLLDEPPTINIIASDQSKDQLTIVAKGPVLHPEDMRNFQTILKCDQRGIHLSATVTRDVDYPLAVAATTFALRMPWRPIIRFQAILRNNAEHNVTVVWKLRLSTGNEISHSREGVPPYRDVPYPVVVEKLLTFQP